MVARRCCHCRWFSASRAMDNAPCRVPLQGTRLDGVDLLALVAQYGTPLYLYHSETIQANLAAYRQHRTQPSLYYAVKANSNLALLKRLGDWGAGFDIVSQGELERVLLAGGRGDSMVFSGVGKTDAEIRRALSVGVGCVHVESAWELERLAQIAAELDVVAKMALRVNPDVDAKTHPYISTGMKENKFGIAIENAPALYRKAAENPYLQICGINCHIGSQITSLSPFVEALQSLLRLADALCKDGIALKYLDIGGGLGIPMDEAIPVPTADRLVEKLYNLLGGKPYRLHLQPGRSLVAEAGILLSGVIGVKVQSRKRFVVIDAAMNDYMRPALYQAVPPIWNLARKGEEDALPADVVGPVCESGDVFGKHLPISVKRGDILAIGSVGAYGMSMSSQYNSRPRAAEVLIENGQARLIRKRESLSQLWENELCD